METDKRLFRYCMDCFGRTKVELGCAIDTENRFNQWVCFECQERMGRTSSEKSGEVFFLDP